MGDVIPFLPAAKAGKILSGRDDTRQFLRLMSGSMLNLQQSTDLASWSIEQLIELIAAMDRTAANMPSLVDQLELDGDGPLILDGGVPANPVVVVARWPGRGFSVGLVPIESIYPFSSDCRSGRIDALMPTRGEAWEVAYALASRLGGLDVIDRSLKPVVQTTEDGGMR